MILGIVARVCVGRKQYKLVIITEDWQTYLKVDGRIKLNDFIRKWNHEQDTDTPDGYVK